MITRLPAGTPGPHVFVETLDAPEISEDDLGHLTRSLRMRDGDPLTISDGDGSWCRATFVSSGQVEQEGDVQLIPARPRPLTIGFSLVKGHKPELVMQKLTELGIDRIVVLIAERSVVKWDDAKAERAGERWSRIVREASMQSHRVRLPEVVGLTPATEWLSMPEVVIAHFGGEPISAAHHSIAIGPEGGWSPGELDSAGGSVSLGDTVLRAETAAIAAGTLLSAAASR